MRLTRTALALLLSACTAPVSPDGDTGTGSVDDAPGRDVPATDAPRVDAPVVPPGDEPPAVLGAPSGTIFNGLRTVLDPFTRNPRHAIDATRTAVPMELSEGLPYIPDLRTLNRRDTVIIYLPNVAGAADYRAYAVPTEVASTARGRQPRGALVACAGYRQHTYRSDDVDGYRTRELLQTVELPGFVSSGDHTIIVEAIASPCPFVGIPGHTDAQLTMRSVELGDGSVTSFPHWNQPDTYHYLGVPRSVYRSRETIVRLYGNEILNGHGASIDWRERESVPLWGEPVAPDDPVIVADPTVLARTAIVVRFPADDESLNAPVLAGLGSHGIEDNFDSDVVVPSTTAAMHQNPDFTDASAGALYPAFTYDGRWEFFGRNFHAADMTPGVSYLNEPGFAPLADWGLASVQVFSRHGRLYTAIGDAGQDVPAALSFASLEEPVVTLDGERYVHSMFRVNAESSHRRYWYWTICGADSRDALFDDAAGTFRVRPLLQASSFGPGGWNPSVPDTRGLNAAPTPNARALECLSITEEGRHTSLTDIETPLGRVRSSAEIRAQIHPAGYETGIISLANDLADDGGEPGFRYRIDGAGNYAGPMLEPFDSVTPLTHFDVFLRPDRLVLFINGRQALCVDMSARPLTMGYGTIGYGDLIYHSSVEWQELSHHLVGGTDANNADGSQLYFHQLNTPVASARVWDFVAQVDGIEIPTEQFTTFDPSLCRPPSDLGMQ